MLLSLKVKEGESEDEGVNITHRVTNEVMNDWMESNVVQDIVNEKNKLMNPNQNWVACERKIGVKKKRVEFFIRVKTRVRFYKLKSSAWDECVEERSHASVKNSKMKHAKKVGMLVGVCISFAPKK